MNKFRRKDAADSTDDIADKEIDTNLFKQSIILNFVVVRKVRLYDKGSSKSIRGKKGAKCYDCFKILRGNSGAIYDLFINYMIRFNWFFIH